MAGGTLTPGAVTGKNVLFTSSTAVFFTSDVGRLIIYGASRAIIISFGASAGDTTTPNTNVRADILDPFPNTNPILSGLWLLRLSPQSALDPNKKEPVGSVIVLTADKPTFRGQDVGKYIHIYGGVVRIKSVDSVTQVTGEILSVLSVTAADPTAAPAGSWTLEEASWSDLYGFPRTGEFFQGRLAQASTQEQPTTFWLSESDSFDRYAVGIKASDAIEYTIASRQLNRIEWLADNIDLFLGTSGSELVAKSGKSDEPMGGDIIPKIEKTSSQGSGPIQPLSINGRVLFVDRSLLQIYSQVYDFESNRFNATEITAIADHVTGTGIRLGPMAFQRRLDSRAFFVRSDGTLLVLTYFVAEKVVGFTRFTTQGLFEAVACIPQASGKPDQIWVIVRRTINGATRSFVEVFDDYNENIVGREWPALQTDSAVTANHVSGVNRTTQVGLGHLEGMAVDVIADGGYKGVYTVVNESITLPDPFTEIEVGLHYDSKVVTMRPGIPQQVIEGIPRSWDQLFTRVYKSRGGQVDGEPLQYPVDNLGTMALFSGDVAVPTTGWSLDGRITVEQKFPYPFTLLALFGTLSLGDGD